MLLSLVLVVVVGLVGCSIPTPPLDTSVTTATAGGAESQSVLKGQAQSGEGVGESETATGGAEVAASTDSGAAVLADRDSAGALASPELQEGTILDAVEATLGEIYAQVSPSVVNIQVVQGTASLPEDHPVIPGSPFDPGELPPQQGLGSGFVWDTEGHIVTNNHVVAGAERIRVTFQDDMTVPGEVVGTDPDSDLAVVKVDLPAAQLDPIEMGDSTAVRVGQLAVAIGNPFGLEGTMTVGFVSALGRSLPVGAGTTLGPTYTIPDIIQTDAPINPGNSGGVLVNDDGQVIGVPTAIESPVRANAGIGFAVPSVIVQKVVPVLISDGQFQHSWLGISGTTLTGQLAEAMGLNATQRGVLVAEVVTNSPAEEANLQGSDRQVELDGQTVQVGGDVIVGIDDQEVREFEDLVTHLARHTSVGQTVNLTLLRNGEQVRAEVTLAARPGERAQLAESQPEPRQTGGAWLGIRGLTLVPEVSEAMDLLPEQSGVLVIEVVAGSPADAAGLRGGSETMEIEGQQIQVGGDVVVAADGERVEAMEDLLAILGQAEPGQEVNLDLLRNGEQASVNVTLGERPASLP
jgi:S1-C subfamily serine protease